MNIVVTGATGFIGRYAISYLQGKGHRITALVRNIDKAKDLLGFFPDTTLDQALDEIIPWIKKQISKGNI